MSNPLLRPNDPRFQKPSIVDTAGQNRFAEGSKPPEGAASGGDNSANENAGDAFAANSSDARPYQPQYEVTHRSRSGLLLVLGIVGWVCASVGTIAVLGLFDIGWIAPLLGIVPAMTAWLLAHEDLKTLRLGAMDEQDRPRLRQAYWVGLSGLLACIGMVAWMIFLGLSLLPDLM
jgi:hypothetical protein